MPTHVCEVCQKVFKQKGHLTTHRGRKNPCTPAVPQEVSLHQLIEQKVQEVLLTNDLITPCSSHFTYVDFFAGIGGFRYGIEAFQRLNPTYSFKCIKSVDIKKDALKTYNLNFGESNEPCDICTVKNLPHFNLLCAGFPCQPFSSAGNKKGFEDEGRGNLIYEVIRICKESVPDYLLLENVSNIELLDKGRILQKIVSEFEAIGYHITCVTVNASEVGLAQDRKRLFIVGSRTTKPVLTIPPSDPHTIDSVIDESDTTSNLPDAFLKQLLSVPLPQLIGRSMKDKRGGEDNIHSWDIGYHGPVTDRQKTLLNKILTERRKKKWAELKGIVWMDGMPLSLEEIRTFLDYEGLAEDLTDLVTKKYLVVEHPKDLVDNKRQYKTDAPQGYNISKGKLSFPVSKVLDPKGLSPTLTATDSSKLAVFVKNTIRSLNPLELKRLCGFPESMRLPEKVNAYDLFGNMVCPPVITAILQQLLP